MSYLGNEPQFTQYPSKFFNGNGTAQTVALDYAPPNAAAVLVFIDGVRQDTSAYTLAGTNLTFTGSVPSGTNNVQVVHMGMILDVGVPGDDTVTTVKIQDDAVTADKLGTTGTASTSTFLRGDMAWTGVSNTPSFRADMSANQSITTNTATKVAFNTERWDTNSAYDPTTNYRFTVPAGEAGKYYFGGFARFDGTGMDNVQWRYLVNNATTTGSRASIFTQTLIGSGHWTGFGVSSYPFIADLNVADYVEVFIFASTGSSLTMKAGSGSYYQCSSWFGFKLIG